jgi:hypothetical protein
MVVHTCNPSTWLFAPPTTKEPKGSFHRTVVIPSLVILYHLPTKLHGPGISFLEAY